MIMNPETPSQLVQLICRLLPNSRLSKKMKNTEKDGLKIIEKMEGKEGKEREKRDLKIQKLLEKDRMMDEEFKRLGF